VKREKEYHAGGEREGSGVRVILLLSLTYQIKNNTEEKEKGERKRF